MDYYNEIDMHRRMVGDRVRLAAFRDSLQATIKPGDVVLDVGAGSGVLSLLAAQAGAARVYAVERAPGAAALARQLVVDNQLTDCVQVIEADVQAAPALEPVDVIVSEWLGVYGVDENMLAALLTARDRWLKPDGLMIPGDTTAWIVPVCCDAGAEAITFHDHPAGLNLAALAPFDPNEVVWLADGARADDFCAEPQPLWTTQPVEMPLQTALQPHAAQLTFRLDGPANGLVAWFSTELPGGIALTNRPGDPATHWGNFLFPVAHATGAQPSDTLVVDFHCVPFAGGGSHHIWVTQLNDGLPEHHDTRRIVRSPKTPPWRVRIGQGNGDGGKAPPADQTIRK